MVERARLIDAPALAAQPREREYAIHDETLRGLILRVQLGGSRSWVFRFRRDGKPLSRHPRPSQDGDGRIGAREGRRPPRSPASFRPDACAVRGGVRRAAISFTEVVNAQGDHELPA